VLKLNRLKIYLLNGIIIGVLMPTCIYILTFYIRPKNFIIYPNTSYSFNFRVLIFLAIVGLLVGVVIGFIIYKIENKNRKI